MTIGAGLVLLVTVVVIVLLLLSVLRPRRRRLANRGRRRRGYRWRRMDAIKRAAAADIAMIQGNDRLPSASAGGEREGEP
jgi:hypothetical protein